MKTFCKFPTINISKPNFWLVICIAKNFIWTTLKAIFLIFFRTLRLQIDFQIVSISDKYCPILTNHRSMESLLYIYILWPLWLVLWSRVTLCVNTSNKAVEKCYIVYIAIWESTVCMQMKLNILVNQILCKELSNRTYILQHKSSSWDLLYSIYGCILECNTVMIKLDIILY